MTGTDRCYCGRSRVERPWRYIIGERFEIVFLRHLVDESMRGIGGPVHWAPVDIRPVRLASGIECRVDPAMLILVRNVSDRDVERTLRRIDWWRVVRIRGRTEVERVVERLKSRRSAGQIRLRQQVERAVLSAADELSAREQHRSAGADDGVAVAQVAAAADVVPRLIEDR